MRVYFHWEWWSLGTVLGYTEEMSAHDYHDYHAGRRGYNFLIGSCVLTLKQNIIERCGVSHDFSEIDFIPSHKTFLDLYGDYNNKI